MKNRLARRNTKQLIDYLELEELRKDLSVTLERTNTATSREDSARSASNLRIAEGQIVLLHDHIRERSSQKKGYEATYVRMESLISEVLYVFDRGAAEQLPTEKEKHAVRAKSECLILCITFETFFIAKEKNSFTLNP
jgi:hypothetical protein